MFTLSACADLSMYNQVPAPIGRSGEAQPSQQYPQGVKTYPIEDTLPQESTKYSLTAPSLPSLNVQNPAVVALLDSAHQQSENGQLDIAASKLERAVRIEPRDAQVWHALAKIRYGQNNHALAISLSKKSNVLAVNDRRLQRSNWLLMAACYKALGNTNSANKARENASRLF